MGVAAYNRGSLAIRRQLEAQSRPVEFEIMDVLNALPKYPDAGTPNGPVRLAFSHKGWWIVCPKTGFGYWYKTLHEAVKRWKIAVIGKEHQEWLAVPLTVERKQYE